MNIQDIQYLRQETGAGIMDCKNALNKVDGDLQQALAVLQDQGFQLANKKAGSGAKVEVTGFFRYEKADGLQNEEGINNCGYARQMANK